MLNWLNVQRAGLFIHLWLSDMSYEPWDMYNPQCSGTGFQCVDDIVSLNGRGDPFTITKLGVVEPKEYVS